MTLDICGHLFPRYNDNEKLAAAERALLDYVSKYLILIIIINFM
jgi:hypothetical protein